MCGRNRGVGVSACLPCLCTAASSLLPLPLPLSWVHCPCPTLRASFPLPYCCLCSPFRRSGHLGYSSSINLLPLSHCLLSLHSNLHYTCLYPSLLLLLMEEEDTKTESGTHSSSLTASHLKENMPLLLSTSICLIMALRACLSLLYKPLFHRCYGLSYLPPGHTTPSACTFFLCHLIYLFLLATHAASPCNQHSCHVLLPSCIPVSLLHFSLSLRRATTRFW